MQQSHDGLPGGSGGGSGSSGGDPAVRDNAAAPPKPPSFARLQRNRIVGRDHVAPHPDTVPECNCRPGGSGCEPADCLNAALRIECTAGHCACGDACANQRMQRRQNAPTWWASAVV